MWHTTRDQRGNLLTRHPIIAATALFALFVLISCTKETKTDATDFAAPANIAVPIKNYVHLSDHGPDCTRERISQLRWRSDRSLEICTGDMWRSIRVAGNAGQAGQ